MAKHNAGGNYENFSDPIVIVIVLGSIVGLFVLIWLGFHTIITTINIYIRYMMGYPLYLISAVFKDIAILSYPYDYIQTYCAPQYGLLGFCTKDFSKFEFNDVIRASLPWNLSFGFILIFLLVKSIILTQRKHPQALYSHKHDLKSFMIEQQENYSHLKMFVKLDLINEPINHPIFGMSLTAKQFIGIYALTRENEKSDWTEREDGSYLPIVDQECLHRVLIAQLGKIWQGWKKLSDTELIIFAALLPLVAATDPNMSDVDFAQAKKESKFVREQAWALFDKTWDDSLTQNTDLCEDEKRCMWLLEPQIDRTIFYPMIEKYRTSTYVQEIISNHAFVRTMIYGLLIKARSIGVLEAADFRWLRFCDRSLWYVIETVGRRRPFAEASAVFDHYNHEVMSESAIYSPCIKNAIIGINEQVGSYKYSARNVLLDDYSIWLNWRPSTIQKMYPGIDIGKAFSNLNKK